MGCQSRSLCFWLGKYVLNFDCLQSKAQGALRSHFGSGLQRSASSGKYWECSSKSSHASANRTQVPSGRT